MGLFDKFTDTIFLKEDSNLEEQINRLKEVRNEHNKYNVDKDIKLLEYGLMGEEAIAFELKHSNLGMVVLHDITIECDDLKAQIDYLIFTKGFIYVVECKNLIGNITVDNNGEFIREYELNGKKIKEGVYSAYTQAVRHKEVIKKRWLKKNTSLFSKLISSNFDKMWYKPLVVIANPKSMVNVKYAPKEIKENVVRVDQLLRYIEKDINNYDKDSYFSKKNMLENAQSFLDIDTSSNAWIADKYKSNEIEEVKEEVNNNSDNLKTKLIEFRTIRSKEKGIPAYYVFNNEELDLIVNNKPVTKEELLKCIPSIKVNSHGNEIIDIIKQFI